MIKILFFAVLLYYLLRVIARVLTFPSRMNHENEARFSENRDEKDVSDKGRIL